MFLDCIGKTKWLTGCQELGVCIPAQLAVYTRLIYNAMMVITPLVLIVIGMYDLAKAVTSKSAEDIKKAQNMLVKKAIAGAIVFVLFSLVSWMLSILSSTSDDPNGEKSIIKCLNSLFVSDADTGESGITEGFTDGGALCRNYEYDGIMKIYKTGGSGYFFSCYKLIQEKPTSNFKGTCESNYYYIMPGKKGIHKVCLKFFQVSGAESQKNRGAIVTGYGGTTNGSTVYGPDEDGSHFFEDIYTATTYFKNQCTPSATACDGFCTDACSNYTKTSGSSIFGKLENQGEIIIMAGKKECLCFRRNT